MEFNNWVPQDEPPSFPDPAPQCIDIDEKTALLVGWLPHVDHLNHDSHLLPVYQLLEGYRDPGENRIPFFTFVRQLEATKARFQQVSFHHVFNIKESDFRGRVVRLSVHISPHEVETQLMEDWVANYPDTLKWPTPLGKFRLWRYFSVPWMIKASANGAGDFCSESL